MTFEQLTDRISNALEAELAAIYDELGIETGDISPLAALEWDEVTAKAAHLFRDLIEQNKEVAK